MNNARLLDDEPELVVDTTVSLQERKIKLTRMLEAINNLSKDENWHVLKELLFDPAVKILENNLRVESEKFELLLPAIYRLQGQLSQARRYSDLYKLAETYKLEINSITKKLNENANN